MRVKLNASEWRVHQGYLYYAKSIGDPENEIPYLEKQREIVGNIIGEDNPEMNKNAHKLYQIYKEQDSKKAMFYLEKAV